MACKMWFGFQFNLSDSSDDDLYRLDLDPDLYVAGIIFWCTQKKLSRGCLRVRLDTNANANANADADADANRSKTICRLLLKGGRHNKSKRSNISCFIKVSPGLLTASNATSPLQQCHRPYITKTRYISEKNTAEAP